MYTIEAIERPYGYGGQQDYEVVTSTDKGLVFRSPDDELIWMEVEGASDVLIDDAPPPQDEMSAALHGARRGRRRGASAPAAFSF